MFFRDSQFPRDSQLSGKGSTSSRDRKRIPTAHEPESDDDSLSETSKASRNQSWQVAPNLFSSFRYAWAGISYAFSTQRNFRIHTAVGTIAILACWALKVSTAEIAIVCLTIGAVLVMEILNTALESLVDLTVGQTYHELAKIAKDCAAGAVLMAAVVALLIATLIFVPPLWQVIQLHWV